MKAKRLLSKLNQFLDTTQQAEKREINALRKLLKQLKDKEKNWQKKQQSLPAGDEQVELTAKIAVIHIQRQKGIERLQALKSAKKTQN